jgi:hypothetical protein
MYSERIVLFVDILGFKELVENGEFDKVNKVYDTFRKMINETSKIFAEGTSIFENAFKELTNDKKPESILNPNDAEVMFFSDCIVWTYPTNKLPKIPFAFILMTLCRCFNVLLAVLFTDKILIRGGVSIGEIYFNAKENKVFGKALIKSYELEQIAMYPRIIFDENMINGKMEPHIYERFFKYALTYNHKGFYAHNYFDNVRVSHHYQLSPEVDEQLLRIAKKNFTDGLIECIKSGINHPHQGARKKYEWLKAKLSPFEEF